MREVGRLRRGYDRIVITETLPGACWAAGMTSFLNARHLRIFGSPRLAEPLRERIRAGAQIEHVAKEHVRKEDVVAAVIKRRDDHPGLVHILSAMEACNAHEPWHDKHGSCPAVEHEAENPRLGARRPDLEI
jgi:hypothetical protein